MTISSLTVDLQLTANKFNNQIKSAQREMKEFEKSVRPTKQLLDDVGRTATAAGKGLTVGVTLPLVGAGAAALKFSTDFNKSMANVATLIPGNTERVIELKRSVQDMAVATGKSTADLSDGLFQVISAFGDSAESASILEINAKAAAAGMATTTDAINLTSAVTKGYGDVSAAAIQKAADLAFKTNELGQTTFPELAASMGRVIPIAATLGVSQEELFAGFASLTGVTGNASEVSTQMAAVLKAMLKPTADMSGAMKKLGFSSSEAMLQQLGMKGALDALIGTTDGTTEATGKLFGRAEALSAVFALTGDSADKFNSSLTAMENASGSANTAFGEISEGINAAGFKMDQFKQRLVVAAQRTGDALVPALNAALNAIEPLLGWIEKTATAFSEMSPSMQLAVAGLAALAAAIGPVIAALGLAATGVAGFATSLAKLVGFLKGAGGVTVLMTKFGTSLKGLAIAGGPILVTVAAIAGLGVALWKLKSAFDASTKAQDDNRTALSLQAESTERAAKALRDNYAIEVERGTMSTTEWGEAIATAASNAQWFELRTRELADRQANELDPAIVDVTDSTDTMNTSLDKQKTALEELAELTGGLTTTYEIARKVQIDMETAFDNSTAAADSLATSMFLLPQAIDAVPELTEQDIFPRENMDAALKRFNDLRADIGMSHGGMLTDQQVAERNAVNDAAHNKAVADAYLSDKTTSPSRFLDQYRRTDHGKRVL